LRDSEEDTECIVPGRAGMASLERKYTGMEIGARVYDAGFEFGYVVLAWSCVLSLCSHVYKGQLTSSTRIWTAIARGTHR
jgi:hypothetical protein